MTAVERIAERVAGSPRGRAALSVPIALLAIFTIAWNLPPGYGPASSSSSALRRDIMYAGAPVMYALGLDQNWDVFAPPSQQVIHLEAVIKFANGKEERWKPPTATGALFGTYRDYRWGKYAEQAIADANSNVWQPLAEWVAREHTTATEQPVTVELIRRWYELFEVKTGAASRSQWMHYTYEVYHVPGAKS